MKHPKESRNSSTLFTKWLTIALLGWAAILAGCGTGDGNIQSENPRDCPGVPPAADFNVSLIELLKYPELTAGYTAYTEGDYAESEKQYRSFLQKTDKPSLGDHVRKYAATGLVSALCVQGKHEEAAIISKQYGVPF